MSSKKSSRRSTPRSRSRSKTGSTSSPRRFLQALFISAAASFAVASCALQPQLARHVPIAPVLEQLGFEVPAAFTPAAPTGQYAQTRFSSCPQFFPQGKAPVVPAGASLRELCYDAFAILHNGDTRTPVLVAQRLNRQMLQQAGSVQRSDRFFADSRIPAAERAELADYRNSGYSRGHMAPAADMHTPAAMAQSFSLANMVPQNQRHNSGAWSKIENDTRKYVMRAAGDVYVFTGPVYEGAPERIGPGGVAVPRYLYKVVYDAQTGRSWVHWQENSAQASAAAPISYEEFERRTGLRLVPVQ